MWHQAPSKTTENLSCLAVAYVVRSPAFKSVVRLPSSHTGVAWSVSVSAFLTLHYFPVKGATVLLFASMIIYCMNGYLLKSSQKIHFILSNPFCHQIFTVFNYNLADLTL
jgi:hypothetical protein